MDINYYRLYILGELEKIADAISEGNPVMPIDNSEPEHHKTDVKELKRKMKRRKLRVKVPLKKEKPNQETKPTTNNGSEYEEGDPERDAYNEKVATMIGASKKANKKITIDYTELF